MAVQPPDEAGRVDGEEVERQLARILLSPDFVNASRLAAFLQYIMAKTLTGKADQIKEYTIGIEVFDKPESFDPRLDTLVRVQASKLRARLAKYYSGPGLQDPIHIDLPRGTYVPVVTRAETRETTPKKRTYMALAGVGLMAVAGLIGWLAYRSARANTPVASEKSIAESRERPGILLRRNDRRVDLRTGKDHRPDPHQPQSRNTYRHPTHAY